MNQPMNQPINQQQMNQPMNQQQINQQPLNQPVNQQMNAQPQQIYYQQNQNNIQTNLQQAGIQQQQQQQQQQQMQPTQTVNTFNTNPGIRTVNMQSQQGQPMNVHPQNLANNPQGQAILLNKALNSNHNVMNVQQQQQQIKQMPVQAPQNNIVRQQLQNHIINSSNVNNNNNANLRNLLQGKMNSKRYSKTY